jgi:uncharacterized protein YneF (UPF0154 family)
MAIDIAIIIFILTIFFAIIGWFIQKTFDEYKAENKETKEDIKELLIIATENKTTLKDLPCKKNPSHICAHAHGGINA